MIMATLGGVSAQHILDAMDGVAYLVALDGEILAVGEPDWSEFADANASPGLTAAAVVGTSLFAAIAGDPLREAFRRMHVSVGSGHRAEVGFQYRCDSPAIERHMRMSIRPVAAGGLVLYQSQVLAEIPRPPLNLFAREWRAAGRQGLPADLVVVLCSFCHRVVWPIGADEAHQRWITPVEYYRLGGPSDIAVSHGLCPECYKVVVLPNV
jgi:hypothetical protein